jgi:hypothetical protein
MKANMGKTMRTNSLKDLDMEDKLLTAPVHHSVYKVKNEEGEAVGIDILILFYGSLWEFALKRLEHKIDGYLFTIQYNGKKFSVYRKLKKERNYPSLNLVKPLM